ncbi:MAG: transcriptional regulator NrdR [Gammaproteobacteria bacterium]|nr:transcriptional regulator NrdR [Gammaproteobacteria bacterium]
MRCPFCSATRTKVIDSRDAHEGSQVRRRRQCLSCGERFTTYEQADIALPRIIKNNNERQTFSEKKLQAGLALALQKRPVSTEQLDNAILNIRHRLLTCRQREVNSRLLGEWVMEELRQLDHVAYIRFASVYKSYEDLQAFREALDRLDREPSP